MTPSPSAPDDSFSLFVREPSGERPEYPVKFALFGAFGDLALSRINRQLYEYISTIHPKSLLEVYLCDIISDSSEPRLLAELYSRCRDYRQLDNYFTREFQELMSLQGGDGNHDVLDVEKAIASVEGEAEEPILTPLGQFIIANYQVTASEQDFTSVFSTPQIIDTDWIFYLALPPAAYTTICSRIQGRFKDATPHFETSDTRKLILIEKPFQTSLKKARDLADILEVMEEESPGFQFYSVDHYAAKWTLSRLPAMVRELQTFRDIVSNTERVVIDLVETKDIPEFRTSYMASTGLFNDMMPHALVALQFLFAGKRVTVRGNRSECLVVGTHEDFVSAAGNLPQDLQDSPHSLETYFSLKIELCVSEQDQEATRTVTVYIRCAKALGMENKKVHIIPHREEDDLPFFTIDIAREDFPEPTIESGYPESLTDGDVSKGELRGYSKIIFDAVSFLRRNKSLRKDALPPPLEFLTPRQSVEIIGNMMEIRKYLQKNNAGQDPFQNPRTYSSGIPCLDEEKEFPILSPISPGGQETTP